MSFWFGRQWGRSVEIERRPAIVIKLNSFMDFWKTGKQLVFPRSSLQAQIMKLFVRETRALWSYWQSTPCLSIKISWKRFARHWLLQKCINHFRNYVNIVATNFHRSFTKQIRNGKRNFSPHRVEGLTFLLTCYSRSNQMWPVNHTSGND